MLFLWLGLGVAGFLILFHWHVKWMYGPYVVKIFQEKPFFLVPADSPLADAEAVRFPSTNGLTLSGCYLHGTGPRKGVIIFGLQFGANRWSCVPYCDFLRKNGFDIFAFEFRNQGQSDALPGYEPLQWVTDFEVEDFCSALTYLKSRPDADPRGVGLFGISKGGSAGLMAAAEDNYVRCCATDGVFASHTTMVPYMQKWINLYCILPRVAQAVPQWYYALIAHHALKKIAKQRRCFFPHLEHVIHRLSPRPLLMIHGGGDTYIKPEMARALFERAAQPKEFWLVENAKHNQAFTLASPEYQKRILAFFEKHLVAPAMPGGSPHMRADATGKVLANPDQPWLMSPSVTSPS